MLLAWSSYTFKKFTQHYYNLRETFFNSDLQSIQLEIVNKNIRYILVYTFTCAFPILLGYSLVLYYQAQHYLLTRDCDHLIGRCRDILSVLITEYRLPNAQLYPLVRAKNGHLTLRAIPLLRLLCHRSRPKTHTLK